MHERTLGIFYRTLNILWTSIPFKTKLRPTRKPRYIFIYKKKSYIKNNIKNDSKFTRSVLYTDVSKTLHKNPVRFLKIFIRPLSRLEILSFSQNSAWTVSYSSVISGRSDFSVIHLDCNATTITAGLVVLDTCVVLWHVYPSPPIVCTTGLISASYLMNYIGKLAANCHLPPTLRLLSTFLRTLQIGLRKCCNFIGKHNTIL